MKKKLSIVALVMALTLAFAACGGNGGNQQQGNNNQGDNQQQGGNEPAKKITMKLSHNSSPGSARDQGCFKIKEIMDEKFPGVFDSAVYPSGQLGGQRDLVEGCQYGTIEVSVAPTSYLGAVQPLVTMLDTPFWLPEKNSDLMELYASDEIRALLDTTESSDIITMGMFHDGYKHYTANKPVPNPEDVKGMKVRIMASPILVKQAEVLGENAITMDFGETYSALQSGAIDGQDNPIATCYDMKFHEVQKYFTLTYHSVLDQVVMVSKIWMEGNLNQEQQDALWAAVKDAGVVANQATLDLEKKDKEEMEKSGVTFVELTAEQRQAWIDTLAPVKEYARTSFGDEGVKLFDNIDAKINEIVEKNA